MSTSSTNLKTKPSLQQNHKKNVVTKNAKKPNNLSSANVDPSNIAAWTASNRIAVIIKKSASYSKITSINSQSYSKTSIWTRSNLEVAKVS